MSLDVLGWIVLALVGFAVAFTVDPHEKRVAAKALWVIGCACYMIGLLMLVARGRLW